MPETPWTPHNPAGTDPPAGAYGRAELMTDANNEITRDETGEGPVVAILGTPGAPTSGTWVGGQTIVDSVGVHWLCTSSGSPGTWVQSALVPSKNLSDVASPATALGTLGGLPLAGGTMTGALGFAHGTQPNEFWVSKGSLASDSNSGDKDAPFATIAAAVAAALTAGGPCAIHLGYGTWVISAPDSSGNAVTLPAQEGCVLEGIGMVTTTIQVGCTATWGVALTSGLCKVKDLMVTTTTGGAVTYGCGVTVPNKSSGSAEQCRFDNVWCTTSAPSNPGGTMTYGFSVGGDTTGGAIDLAETRFCGCSAYGTTTAGYLVGNGTVANILTTTFDGCTSSHSTYGIECFSAGAVWNGGALTYNSGGDIYLNSMNDGDVYKFGGFRSEGSAVLFTTTVDSGAATISLEDVVYEAQNMISTGYFIRASAGGTLKLKNIHCLNNGSVTPKIACETGGHLTVEADGLMTATPIGTLFNLFSTTNIVGTISGYVQLTSTGSIPPVAVVQGPVNLQGKPITAAPPAAFFSGPFSPAGTVSTTGAMAGLGVTFTPSATGKVLVLIFGNCGTQTAVANVTLVGKYGTGTAPANGAAPTGTTFPQGSVAVRPTIAAGGNYQPFQLVGTLTGLTVGTTYWFDIDFLTSSASDQADIGNIMVVVQECS